MNLSLTLRRRPNSKIVHHANINLAIMHIEPTPLSPMSQLRASLCRVAGQKLTATPASKKKIRGALGIEPRTSSMDAFQRSPKEESYL